MGVRGMGCCGESGGGSRLATLVLGPGGWKNTDEIAWLCLGLESRGDCRLLIMLVIRKIKEMKKEEEGVKKNLERAALSP